MAGNCQLSCDYCYVYQLADTSYARRPSTMSMSTLTMVGKRIAEHAIRHDLQRVEIVFHGGEPLLIGRHAMERSVSILRKLLPPNLVVDFAVQTNGLLLDPAMLGVLHGRDVKIGISLDGGRQHHDRHRTFSHGGGSYESVAQAVSLLASSEFRSLFLGLLCVVDLDNDPIDVLNALGQWQPPTIDLLLPHGSWATPPPKRPDDASTPYGTWLARAFDHWFDSPRQPSRIRLFDEIIHLLLGGAGATDMVGLSPATYLVIDTDGSLQQTDTLKSAFDGAAETGLDVFANTINEALAHPDVVMRQAGLDALSDTCQTCSIVAVCGGGHYAHRYRHDEGFRNPSVYCADLEYLIRHIHARVVAAT